MIKSKHLARAFFKLHEENNKDANVKFFDFIKKNNLTHQLPSILYHLEKIYEIESEKNFLKIETAHNIKTETILDIKKYLQINDLKDVVVIKEDLIAGFRAKWKGFMYDSSIENSIKKLQKEIIR